MPAILESVTLSIVMPRLLKIAMIDDPLEVERLLVRMEASLPLRAEATPALVAALGRQAQPLWREIEVYRKRRIKTAPPARRLITD